MIFLRISSLRRGKTVFRTAGIGAGGLRRPRFGGDFRHGNSRMRGERPRISTRPPSLNYPEPFLSGSGEKRQAVAQIPLDGIGLGAAGNSSTEYGYIQNLHYVKIESKIQIG
mgnify:FL=1